MEAKKSPRILIVGGGFGGVEVALRLRSIAGKAAEVTLVSDKTYFEYFPALYKVVTGAIPTEVSIPLWMIFDKTKITVVHDRIIGFKPETNLALGAEGSQYHYDYVVIALGSQTNYFGLDGLDKLSFGFKSVNEALELKQHLCTLFENCENLSHDELVARFHVVIVGGGPSGVELAGDLKDHLQAMAIENKVDPSLITIDLVESNGRLLPMLSEKISVKAEHRLRNLGINIYTHRTLVREDIEQVFMKDMQMKSSTVIWTAGTKINNLFYSIPGAHEGEKKRVAVNSYLQLPEKDNVFIIGDGAATPFSGLAQTAIHNGAYVAQVIKKLLQGKKPESYKPHKGAYVIPIGKNWAIFTWDGLRMYGRFPWFLRSLVDLRYYAHLLSLHRLWYVIREGRKYRSFSGGCHEAHLHARDEEHAES